MGFGKTVLFPKSLRRTPEGLPKKSDHLFEKSYYIENKDAIYGLEFSNTMQELGFKNGDKIISINNQPVKKISEITNMILLNPNTIIKIKRNNNYTELKISDSEVNTDSPI